MLEKAGIIRKSYVIKLQKTVSDIKKGKIRTHCLPSIYLLWMIFCIHSWAKESFLFTVFLGFRLVASSRNNVNIDMAVEAIFINAFSFKSSV